MIRFPFVAGIFCALALTAQAQDITTHTSPQGHAFSFKSMPSAERIAIAIAWEGGMANVPMGKENLPALAIDLMLNGGADGRSPDEIRAEFESMDAGSHLYSDYDAVRGFVVAPPKDLERAATIGNAVLTKPTMEDRWFKRFLRNKTKRVTENTAYNAHQAWNTIRHLTMGGHRLEQAWSDQPVDNIGTLTPQDARDWYAQSFSTTDMSVFAAGAGTADEVGKALDITLAGLPQTHQREDLEPLEMTYSGKTILIHRPGEDKSYMAIVGPMPPAAHPDTLSLQLATGVLGQSEQSRLFKAVRGEVRAAYGFSANIYAFTRAQGMISLQGEVETSKLAQTLEVVEAAYDTFRTDGIGRIEFPFAKRIMVNRITKNFEKPSTIAFVMTEAHMEGRTPQEALLLEEQGKALGRGDVNTAIAEHFPAFAGMLKVIVSPDKDAVAADCVITDFTEASTCF